MTSIDPTPADQRSGGAAVLAPIRAASARAAHFHPSPDAGRSLVERFIEGRYSAAFGGDLNRHYPLLVSLETADAPVAAALGLRLADQGPLFLEQYLDTPIETALEQAFGRAFVRAEIVEVGSLAAVSPQAAQCLFVEVRRGLIRLGRTVAVATTTSRLRNTLHSLGVEIAILGAARPERLRAPADAWGSYYSRDPMVVAGEIGCSALDRRRRQTGPRGAGTKP